MNGWHEDVLIDAVRRLRRELRRAPSAGEVYAEHRQASKASGRSPTTDRGIHYHLERLTKQGHLTSRIVNRGRGGRSTYYSLRGPP